MRLFHPNPAFHHVAFGPRSIRHSLAVYKRFNTGAAQNRAEKIIEAVKGTTLNPGGFSDAYYCGKVFDKWLKDAFGLQSSLDKQKTKGIGTFQPSKGSQLIMRTRNHLALVSAFSAMLFSPPAAAEASANYFLKKIDEGAEMELIALSSYSSGLQWANIDLTKRGLAPLYCAPPKLVITLVQNADILRRYIKTNNSEGELPAGLALLFAYKTTFPCETPAQ